MLKYRFGCLGIGKAYIPTIHVTCYSFIHYINILSIIQTSSSKNAKSFKLLRDKNKYAVERVKLEIWLSDVWYMCDERKMKLQVTTPNYNPLFLFTVLQHKKISATLYQRTGITKLSYKYILPSNIKKYLQGQLSKRYTWHIVGNENLH